MKSKIITFSLAIIAISLLSLGSCRRMSNNGKIDGNWKIYEIYYIADGTTVVPENEFIAIQLELLQLRSSKDFCTAVIGYDKNSDDMYVDFKKINPSILYPFGFGSAQSTVHIDRADSKHLVLSTDIARITCRKY